MSEPSVPSAYNRYLTRGKALLPLVLVLLPLSLLALLPMVTMRITDGLYAHIANDAEAARSHVWEMQHALTLESAATRAYLLTADSAAVAHHQSARAARQRAMQELLRLAPRLDDDTRDLARAVQSRLAAAEPMLDSLFAGSIPRAKYLANLPAQSERLSQVLEASTALDRAIAGEADAALRQIRRTQTVSAVLTIVFVLLAVVAAAMVANLTRQYLESESRFRQISESLHDYVWLADREFRRYLFVNEAYERIWGRSREELRTNPAALFEGIHSDDRERVRHAFSAPPETAYDVEFRVVQPNGNVRWVWSRVFPVRNGRGEVYRIAGITEDVTERKLAAESRVRLIRGFTHDVKNPLGAADGQLALMEEGIGGPLTEQQAGSIRRARRSIRAALNLVTQLLDIARAEAGQIEVQRGEMDVIATAGELAEEFRGQAIARGLDLTLNIPESGEGIRVESDQARVRQILANLLSNAVKYGANGRDGGARGRIVVSARVAKPDDRSGEWATITVSDDGPGIPYDKQNMLFREFTRFDPSAAQGSGIGLAISQRIARALGATITFKSTPGEGSSFTLWLPRGHSPSQASSADHRSAETGNQSHI